MDKNNNLVIKISKLPKDLKFLADEFKMDSIEIPIIDEKKYGLTICYANNGAGKTTVCESIFLNEKLVDKKIEIFSYENNMHIDSDGQFTVSENINENVKREKEISKANNIISDALYDFFKTLGCYPSEGIYKNIIKSINIYGLKLSEYKITKARKNSEKINFKNSDLENFSKNIIDEKGKKIPIPTLIDEKECLKKIKTNLDLQNIGVDLIAFLRGELKPFLKDIFENFNDVKNNLNKIKDLAQLKDCENIEYIKNVYEIIKNLDNLKKCFICEADIEDFEKTKANMKKKINEIEEKLNSTEFGKKSKNIIDKFNEFPNTKNTPFQEMLEMIKNIPINNFKLDDLEKTIIYIDELENLRNDLTDLCKKYFICLLTEKDNCFLNDFIFNEKLIKLIEDCRDFSKKKSINENIKDEFNFILNIIEENIGADRLVIDVEKLTITIDEKNLKEKESLKNVKKLSTGEQNFIAIAFSLFSYLNRYKQKEFEVLCFDDPFNSYDSNFKFIIYNLICIFCSSKSLPIFIFTHSIEYFLLSKNSILFKKFFYILITKKTIGDNSKILGLKKLRKSEEKILNNKELVNWLRNKIKNANESGDLPLLIFAFLPILRSISYLISNIDDNDDKKKDGNDADNISSFLHYNVFREDKDNLKIKEKLTQFLKNFFKNQNSDEKFWTNITEGIFEFSKKLDTQELSDNDFNNLYSFFDEKNYSKNDPINVDNNHLGFHLLKVLIYSIYFRKKIEYHCMKDNDDSQKRFYSRQIKLYKMIAENNKLKKEIKIFFQHIRITSDDVIHQENNFNFIQLALEITPKYLKYYSDKLKKIFNELEGGK